MNYDVEMDGRKRRLSLKKPANGDGVECTLDGEPCNADVRVLEPGILSLLMEGRSYRILEDSRADGAALVIGERRIPYRIADPRSLRARGARDASEAGAKPIVASMPGRIVRILVQAGDVVAAKQGLIVVEAMKMQNELKAPRAGTVTRVSVEVGATVQAGAVLLVIE